MNNCKYLFLLIFLLKITFHSYGNRSDTTFNLQSYTPSVLLKKKQIEIKVFNNLYTETAFFNTDGKRQDTGARTTYFSGINSFLYGISSKINIGFDIYLKSVLVAHADASPFKVLQFLSDTNTRTAITPLGPKIKIAPFKNLQNLSIQSTLLFPMATDLQGRDNGKPYLDHDGFLWWTQVFYDKLFNNKFQLFAEGDIFYRIDKKFTSNNSAFSLPLKAFLSYFPSHKITVYGMSELFPTFGTKRLLSSYFIQSGVGGKYQLFSSLEVELLYTHFFTGNNAGAGQTFNLGMRMLM